MEKRKKLCGYSISALIISILAFALYAMILDGIGLFLTWISGSIAALCFPILAKYMRKKSGTTGKSIEIIALILGSFDFYFVIFAATKWNIDIAFAVIIAVWVMYAKLFNDVDTEELETEPYDTAEDENSVPEMNAASQLVTKVQPASAPPNTKKQRYCKYCGGAIDPETKKCCGCGKQFFHVAIRKKHIVSAVTAAVIMALAWGNIYQLAKHQNECVDYEKQIAELSAMVEEQKSELLQKDRRIEIHENNAKKYREDINELRLERSEMKKIISFYDYSVVFVNNDGTKLYHKYGCDDFGGYSFWAYNTNAAKGEGYKPCPKCCK